MRGAIVSTLGKRPDAMTIEGEGYDATMEVGARVQVRLAPRDPQEARMLAGEAIRDVLAFYVADGHSAQEIARLVRWLRVLERDS